MATEMPSLELPELGYPYDALEPHYSAELLELHHRKHHQAYVDGANGVFEALEEARQAGEFDSLKQLQKDLAFNLSGHVLHSIFWQNMMPDDASDMPAALQSRLRTDFGSTDAFREQFLAAGTSIQGSGWAALSWHPVSGSLLVEQVYDHQDNTASGSVPLLLMDMWEHAFYLQYRNEKKRWAKAFWELINWQDVARRLADAKSVTIRTETAVKGAS